MVYRGRPSVACYACRERRIKCDTTKPGCSQCARMRIACPGYRNALDELFRDESASVSRKARKSYRASVGSNSSRTPTQKLQLSATNPPRSINKNKASPAFDFSIPAPTTSLSESLDDVALVHFMLAYIPGSRFEYLPNLYCHNQIGAPLSTTVHAASLAKLASETGLCTVMDQARLTYTKALSETNAALSNPETAKSDAALVSVLLLTLFETSVWSGTGTPNNWTTHTRGALALIRLRGEQQLDTAVGRQLFTHVAGIICADSLRSRRRLPQDLTKLQIAALRYEDECPRFRLGISINELVTLLADATDEKLSAEEVVTQTQRMDANYVAYLAKLPSSWQYKKVTLEKECPDVCGSMIHQYSSNRAAQLWNSYRMTRIFLNGVLHGYAGLTSLPSANSIRDRAAMNVQQMAAGICASVPQFMDPENFFVASAATLLWPLSAVRGADLVPQHLRQYAEKRLEFLGRELRLPQAVSVACSGEVDPLQDGLHMFYVS